MIPYLTWYQIHYPEYHQFMICLRNAFMKLYGLRHEAFFIPCHLAGRNHTTPLISTTIFTSFYLQNILMMTNKELSSNCYILLWSWIKHGASRLPVLRSSNIVDILTQNLAHYHPNHQRNNKEINHKKYNRNIITHLLQTATKSKLFQRLITKRNDAMHGTLITDKGYKTGSNLTRK